MDGEVDPLKRIVVSARNAYSKASMGQQLLDANARGGPVKLC